MGYNLTSKNAVESVIPEEWGGMWFFKDALGTVHLGFTVLELEPGGKGKKHDHAGGQEEVYYVVHGTVEIDLGEETVQLDSEEAIRIDPEQSRQIHNRGDERATLVLAGAPLDE